MDELNLKLQVNCDKGLKGAFVLTERKDAKE